MKVTSFLTAFLIAGAIPAFCQAPHRSLASIFNSKLAFYLPEPDSTPISTAVLNAGSGAPTIAPNTWISIYGTNLAQTSTDWGQSDFSHGLPTNLAGVTATVNNKPAAISYVSPNQVNLLAPIDTATGPVQVKLSTQFGSTALTPTEQSVSPAFFTIDGSHVAALHVNYSYLGPSSLNPAFTPAKPGETVVLYANGFGQTAPPVTDQVSGFGQALPTKPGITIGNISSQVTFAGLSSSGLYQFNVVVPLNAPNGDLPLVATYNGATTQTGILITVQQ